MHAIQQCRHNVYLCWRDLHGFTTGKEEDCKKWSGQGSGGSKIMWAFQVGLIKGLLAHTRQFKRAADTRSKRKYEQEDPLVTEHTIINRGIEFKNVRCAVCLYLAQEEKKGTRDRDRTTPRMIGRTPMWCPHINCRAHACREHRNSVHKLSELGVNLTKFHKVARIAYTRKHPGRRRKPEGSGQPEKNGKLTKHTLVYN